MVMTEQNEKLKAPKSPAQRAAADAIKELRDSGALAGLFAKIDAGTMQLTGEGGFVPGLIKVALARGLQAELTEHLGYDKGDPEARFYANSRNGTSANTSPTSPATVSTSLARTTPPPSISLPRPLHSNTAPSSCSASPSPSSLRRQKHPNTCNKNPDQA